MATINKSPSEEGGVEGEPPSPAEIAWETLRFLGTAEAAGELAKRLRGEGSGNHDFICYMGLVCSPERAAARDALKRALADPDHPISDTFLGTLRMVESEHHPTDPYTEEEQRRREEGERKVVEELIAVLPNKRGEALPISLNTAVNGAWSAKKLPQETVDKVVDQLIAIFDQLPLSEQCSLLRDRWDKIGRPALLPIVRRLAQFPRERESEKTPGHFFWNPEYLQASAIRRWFELDPVEARAFIIKEIAQPAPRFGVSVFGILPDETLPEVEWQLAKNLRADGRDAGWDGTPNSGALIARYATSAILPQVLKELDTHVAKWACNIQTSAVLAYVLRVDPQAARPRIERALAARGKNSSCSRSLLEEIAAIRYDPVLEEIGIRALDNPNVAGLCSDYARQIRIICGGIGAIAAV